jgi:hypothetical protein
VLKMNKTIFLTLCFASRRIFPNKLLQKIRGLSFVSFRQPKCRILSN